MPSPHEAAAAPDVLRLRPRRRWRLVDFRALWEHRELIYFLAWRDVKVRYKQSVLGVAWAVLQPTLMMIVFTVVFGRFAGEMPEGIPYPLFVFAGLLPWMFFSGAVTSAAASIIASERLVAKVYFPRLAVPLAAMLAPLFDFAIAGGLLLALMAWYGVSFGVHLLLAPLAVLFACVAAAGVGSLLAALNVAYRDFRYIVPFLMQLWMFATPSIYLSEAPTPAPAAEVAAEAPDGSTPAAPWSRLLAYNPMTPAVEFFRAAMLGSAPPWIALATATPLVVGFALLGVGYFGIVEDSFADVI